MRTHTIEIEVNDPDDRKDVPYMSTLAPSLAEHLRSVLPPGLEIGRVAVYTYVPSVGEATEASIGLTEMAELDGDDL